MIFSLPTWNRTVDIYRVVETVAGNTPIGSITGQIYTMLKRSDPASVFCQVCFLYPKDTAIILHGEGQLADVGGEEAYDAVVFPWDDSPHEDGFFHGWVTTTAPRYEAFDNGHNLAVLFLADLEKYQLWFQPPPPPMGGYGGVWSGASNDGCTDCGSLPGTWTSDIPVHIVVDHYDSAPFAWTCSSSGNAIWRFTPPVVVGGPCNAQLLSDDGIDSYAVYEIASTLGWDGVSTLTLTLIGSIAGVCFYPSTIDITPL